MSVAAILLVRDEADIIETTVRHVLEQVDQVLVSDNLSSDGTFEILERLARDHLHLKVMRDSDPAYYQDRKMTTLATLARELGHTWVIPCDADELWATPGERTLGETLAGLPGSAGTFRVPLFDHVATGGDDSSQPDPVLRLGWRRKMPGDKKFWKVACRTQADLKIHMGNHAASSSRPGNEVVSRGEAAIHHYPYRSPEQFIRKTRNGSAALALTDLPEWQGTHWRNYGTLLAEHGEQALIDHYHEWFYVEHPARDPSLTFDPFFEPG